MVNDGILGFLMKSQYPIAVLEYPIEDNDRIAIIFTS